MQWGAQIAHASLNIRITDPPYNAVGDGTTDNYTAFANALADIDSAGGGVLRVPAGTFLVKCTNGTVGYAQPLRVGSDTTIEGENRERSIIDVSTDSTNLQADNYREFLQLGTGLSNGDNVTISKLAFTKTQTMYLELFLVSATNFKLEDSTINGSNSIYNSSVDEADALWIGGYGNVTNLKIENVNFTQLNFGLWSLSSSTGTVDGVHVKNAHFWNMGTSGDGLTFNMPSGVMKNITVDHSTFSDFLTQDAGSGGVVSFANVQDASVTNSIFTNANNDCIHTEDRSAHIEVKHNTFAGCGKLFFGPLFVVGSNVPDVFTHDITFDGNIIDARTNTSDPLSPYLLLVTNGSDVANQPYDINATNNTFWNGPYSQTWYIQPGSEGTVSDNIIHPYAP